jgi:hypothetical protein
MGAKAIEFSPRHQTLVIPSGAQWVPKWYSFLLIIKHLLYQVRPNGCSSGVDNILLGSSSPNILLFEVGPNGCTRRLIFSHYLTQKKTIH